MKILQLSFYLCSGGAERFVVDLSNELAKDTNNEVVLASICDLNEPVNAHYLGEVNPEVRVYNLGCKSGFAKDSFWKVYKLIKAEKPDVVHVHCNLLSVYLASLLYRKATYIHTLHTLAENCLRFSWQKTPNKWLYTHNVQAVTIAPNCHKSYGQLYGIENDVCVLNGRSMMVPSGSSSINTTGFDKHKTFIHVARYAEVKNQGRLFRAFDRLISEDDSVHLICIGSGYEQTPYWEKYKGHPNIHLLGEKKNVADYLALADYFVLSSNYEGLPLTLLESMSLGLIPVSTPAGGVVDVIRDGENGFLSNDFSDEAFYQAIKNCLKHSDTIDRQKIIDEYQMKYSMKACAAQYMKIYKQ